MGYRGISIEVTKLCEVCNIRLDKGSLREKEGTILDSLPPPPFFPTSPRIGSICIHIYLYMIHTELGPGTIAGVGPII